MAAKVEKKKGKKTSSRRQTSTSSWGRMLGSRQMKGWLVANVALIALVLGNVFAHLPAQKRAQFGAFEATLEKFGLITANFTDSIGLTGRDAKVAYTKSLPAQTKFPFGQPKVVDTSKAVTDVRILKRKGYWAGWSPVSGHPVYVAYSVPRRKLLDYPPARPAFERDIEALDCPAPEDYTRSGYDRGHMAPNYVIATRYGKAAQKETFLMSNIVPQSPDLNRGPWRIMEQIVADDLSACAEEVWVITGTVPKEKKTYINRGKARIPKGFFKIIACHKDGVLRAVGVYMPQEIRSDKHPRYCLTSIDEIEAMTGLDFFADLPKADQAILESVEPTRFWPTMGIF